MAWETLQLGILEEFAEAQGATPLVQLSFQFEENENARHASKHRHGFRVFHPGEEPTRDPEYHTGRYALLRAWDDPEYRRMLRTARATHRKKTAPARRKKTAAANLLGATKTILAEQRAARRAGRSPAQQKMMDAAHAARWPDKTGTDDAQSGSS